jgi:hypothetical protein
MEDPCKLCLVNGVCRELCTNKINHINYLCSKLEKLSPYFYTSQGYKRKHIPAHIDIKRENIVTEIKKAQKIARNIISNGRGIENERSL